MDRSSLLLSLRSYQTDFMEELPFVERFIDLLQRPDCFHRHHLPGHITGSSWIVSNDHQHVVLVHHAKLNKWLQPGGHADGNENVLQVALREAEEETGLKVVVPTSKIFDIDIHAIPPRKEMPEHEHFDIRFLFYARVDDPLTISHESNDLKWIPLVDLEQYNDSASVVRMKQKLFRSN